MKTHIKQLNTNDCGIACILMITKSFGFTINYRDVCETLNFNNEVGVSLKKIVTYLKELGISGILLEGNSTYFSSEQNAKFFENKFPIIALIEDENGYSHYIIIWKRSKDEFIISDPNKSYRTKKSVNFISSRMEYIYCINENINTFPNLKQIKNSISVFLSSTVIRALLESKKIIFLLILSVILVSGFSFGLSFYLGFLIDYIAKDNFSNSFSEIKTLSSYMGMMCIFISCIYYLRSKAIVRVSITLEKHISSYYISHLFDQRVPYSTGELMSRLEEAMSVISVILTFSLSVLISLITSILVFIILTLVNISFGITLFVSLVILIMFMFIFTSSLRKKNDLLLSESAGLEEASLEIIDNLNNISLLEKRDFFLKRYKMKLENYAQRNFEFGDLVAKKSTLQFFFTNVLNLFLINIGVYLVIQDTMSLGFLVGLSNYFVIIVNTFQQFDSFQSDLINSVTAYRRMGIVLEGQRIDTSNDIAYKLPSIESVKLSEFTMEINNKVLLNNVNWDIFETGNYIHLKGESGSGKTTLCNQLTKQDTCYNGNILINNFDINNIESHSIREKIVYVSNKEMMFNDTLRNNIVFDKKISNSYLTEILSNLDVLDRLAMLPDFLETIISNETTLFSTGEKQKIILARSVMLEPEILILDEALSNIDVSTRVIILQNLKKYVNKIILVSHDNIEYENYLAFQISDKKIRRE